MEKVEIRKLIGQRKQTFKEYAKALSVTPQWLRKKLDTKPLSLTIQNCLDSDKVLQLKEGTTYMILQSKVDVNDLNDYLDGQE